MLKQFSSLSLITERECAPEKSAALPRYVVTLPTDKDPKAESSLTMNHYESL
jgi:hypothetical protein